MKKIMAVLEGGPFDGDVVEIVGSCFERHVANSFRDIPPWKKVVYTWERRGDVFVGVYQGVREENAQ